MGIGVLVLNVLAAGVAVALNWPAQFDQVGTDAASDVFSKGTAISAPVLPLAILVGSLALIRVGRAWMTVGLVGFCIVAVLMMIGGLGEAFARATPHTPKAVLVASGVVSAAIALTMLGTAIAAFREKRRERAAAD